MKVYVVQALISGEVHGVYGTLQEASKQIDKAGEYRDNYSIAKRNLEGAFPFKALEEIATTRHREATSLSKRLITEGSTDIDDITKLHRLNIIDRVTAGAIHQLRINEEMGKF